MPDKEDVQAVVSAQPARARKPAPPNADMAWVAARLHTGAELRRHAGVGMAPWWALHAPDGKPRRLDDRTVTGLEARGALEQDAERSDAARSVVMVLSDAGRALAASLPAADPNYLTPHERRRGKRAEIWRTKDAAWEAKQGAGRE